MKRPALDVHVAERVVGALRRDAPGTDQFLFDYASGVDASGAVSLSMPVVPKQYDATRTVHPIFEMSLPEGALRERLVRLFGKAIPGFDDLDLLALVGGSQIGRLRFTAPGAPLEPVPTQNVQALLAHRGAEDLMEELLERFATTSGVAGMQPKVLVRDGAPSARVTHRDTTHIVKAFDPRSYPELAANEFFCMRAAALAGLSVPAIQLSKNRRLLAIERFDLAADGRYLGFEDFCVLNGLRSSGRYDSSYEMIARRITQFVSPARVPEALDTLFKMVALACAIGNGDAHLKNFGVLHADPEHEVRIAPAFDQVCTRVYVPRDSMALALAGSKAFPSRATLLEFGRIACRLSPQRARKRLDEVLAGVAAAALEVRRFARTHRDFAPAAKALLRVFDQQREGLSAP